MSNWATYCRHLKHSHFLKVINLTCHGYLIKQEKNHPLGMFTSFSKGSFGYLAHIQTFIFEILREGIINSSRPYFAYMLCEHELESQYFFPTIAFNSYWPFPYYLSLRNYFISLCLLISFWPSFYGNDKIFHRLVFISRKYFQRCILFKCCSLTM